MNTATIDGFNFDLPLNIEQIKALAKYHRKQLHEAIYHQEDRIGDIGIKQRAKIATFTRVLDTQTQNEFYHIYNAELEKLAVDDPIHPPHAEKGVSIFVLLLALILVAGVLYFTFVSTITATT